MKTGNLACFGRSGIGRTLVFVVGVALLLMIGVGHAAAGPATTVVNDIVFRADGSPAGGQLLISWPAFISADGKPVAAGSMSLPIGVAGTVAVALVPNEGGSPAGTYYRVVLKLDDGTTTTEYWSVPKRSPVKVADVRSQLAPQSVAIQTASKQYVDAILAAKADNASVLHTSGDEAVAGVKAFSMSPMVPTPTVASAVANKSYVDAQVAGVSTGDFLRKSGDTMVGTLTLSGDPTNTNQAANRHYVDTQVAGVSSSLAQKLGRQNDTPITMAGARYATQFPSIQAAITDAGANGTVIIPSDYTGTDSFTNPNKIQITDLRGDASGYRGVFNVRDFGAKPDDYTDNWAQIQAAIDAASVGYGPYGAVFVPRGIYHVSKPLHITRGIKFYGAGRGETTITAFTSEQGPVMVVSPPVSAGYNGIPTAPSLATGAGNSMYLNGTYDYLLNLREGGAVELDGRTSLTVELFYKPDQSVTVGTYNIISSSGVATGPDGNLSVAIHHGTNDQVVTYLNINGVLQSVVSPLNTLVKGNTYHIALTYDGSMMRLFINGAMKGSLAVSGAIKQRAHEDFTIGPKVQSFLENTFDGPMTKGWVDSVRISSTARYTADFTPPTAKHANDGNTLFLLNFDNNYDQFTTATTMYGAQTLFLRRFGGGMGQVGNFHLSDMAFIGTGPEFMYMVTSLIENVEITAARRGLHLVNNCYLNRLTSVRVIAQGSAQFGIGIGAASGVLTMSDIVIAGAHYPFYMDTSSAVIHGLWVEEAQGTEIGAVFKGTSNSTAVVEHPVFSTETNPTTVKYSIAEVGFGALTLLGGVLETSASAPHVGVFGGGTVVHVAGNYTAAGVPPASVFQIVAPPTNPVQLIAPMQQWISIPYADNMSYVQVGSAKANQSCTGTDKASGINATGGLTCGPVAGYTLTLMNTGANAPANSSTYYFGGDILDYNNTSFDAAKIEAPKAGTIKRVQIRQNVPSGNTGSAENVTHKVCINTATNCFGGAAFPYNGTSTAGTDITLNQAVAAGDTVAIRVDTPAWATRPSNVRWYAVVYIE
jgi:hypothetical protein